MHKKRSNIILLVFSICLVAGFFVIRDKGYLNADNSGYIISNKKIGSLDQTGWDYDLQILAQGGKKEFRIKHKNGLFTNKYLKLTGFEHEIKECQDQPVDLGNEMGKSLCFIGEVGAHSENIQLIRRLNNGELQIIPFINGEDKLENLVSDVPRFARKDFNNDGYLDLVAENRDYNTDPLSNVSREIYLGTKDGFVFDRREVIQYDIDI